MPIWQHASEDIDANRWSPRRAAVLVLAISVVIWLAVAGIMGLIW